MLRIANRNEKSLYPVLSVIHLLIIALVVSGAPAFAKTTAKSKTSATSKAKEAAAKKAEVADEEEPQEKKKSPDEEDAEEEDSGETDKSPEKKETPAPQPITPLTLPAALDEVVKAASRASSWGIKVTLAQTGQTLYESGAEKGYIPASNRKLFTGALALDQLGPDFVFRTYFYRTGTVDQQGTLNGNLVIKPSGDPTFSTTLYKAAASDWVFRDWAAKAKAAGIKSVSGDLLIDCSQWDMNDMSPQGWPARVMQDSYAPQTSPLTINENLTNLILEPTEKGQPAKVSFAPAATGYPVVNNVLTGTGAKGSKGSVSVRRVPNSHLEAKGSVTARRVTQTIPIDKPTLYAAANLRHHLMENGININGSIRIITSRGTLPQWTSDTLIAMVESPRLIDIVDYMMKRSDNHMAEQIYVAVSAAKTGRGGYNSSLALENDLLRRAGITPGEIQSGDGSGLSESNRVTPGAVCKLLSYMLTHPHSQAYYDCMAISGRDGTLRNRMGNSKMAGRVHAKTGTINGVKTLSGYLMLSSNQTLCFSFLVNNIKGGSISSYQDRICNVLASLVI